jgi:hypothetical protein
MGLKTLAGYLGGIVASVAIFELGDCLAGGAGMGGYWGYAVAVLIVVVFVISMEKVPGFNFVPAWFLGAGNRVAVCLPCALATHTSRPRHTRSKVRCYAGAMRGVRFRRLSMIRRTTRRTRAAGMPTRPTRVPKVPKKSAIEATPPGHSSGHAGA